MKTIFALLPISYLSVIVSAGEATAPAGEPKLKTRSPDLAVLATPQTFTCELRDIYLTRSIGVSSADSKSRSTGTAKTARTIGSDTFTDVIEHSQIQSSDSSIEKSRHDEWQVAGEGRLGLKWGFVPNGSVSFGGNASRTGSTENRDIQRQGASSKSGGSITTSTSTEMSRSVTDEEEGRKVDETRLGDYRLVFSVKLRNTDTTDPLTIDCSRMKATICGQGLTGVLTVSCREKDRIEIGAEETICNFEETITNERQLLDLLRLQSEGTLPRLRLKVSGADFPIYSTTTGKNVLSEQATMERRRPGTLITVEFDELQELSPWRVSRRHTAESGAPGTPVTLREAFQAIESVARAQRDSLPETIFSFSNDGTLVRIVDTPLLKKIGSEEFRMFAVRLTREANGAIETEVRLPLTPILAERITAYSEIALIDFSFSEFIRAAILSPSYFSSLRKDIEGYLFSTDSSALSVLQRSFDSARREDDESPLPKNRESISALDIVRYRQRAEAGIPNMQYKFAVCLLFGWGVDNDAEKAFEWFSKAAEQGHLSAQFWLGTCYNFGKGVEKDMTKAVEWYQKAAEQGQADAQIQLALCYHSGQGVRKNMAQAVDWYHKAAEQGNSDAQFALGYCYHFGEGVEKDLTQAVEWYRKAAEQGVAGAQNELGYCYENGEGVGKDLAKAVEWYRKAADQGVRDAQYCLAHCYEVGKGVNKSIEKSVEWYYKAAEQGFAPAQLNLGYFYENGVGVEKDIKRAVEWYRKAAAQGLAEAQVILGDCYASGQGVDKDMEKAVDCYRKGAEQGFPEAQFCLGSCYEVGKGVNKSRKMSVDWYRKAAEQGHANAKKALKRLGQ